MFLLYLKYIGIKVFFMDISARQAQKIALQQQLLDRSEKFPPGKEGVARVIETLGYIQIDTIAVIQRAHHHTLWTRRPDYTPEMLHCLQVEDRRIFEYWGHAASYLPITDYRYYIPRMRRFADPNSKWEKQRMEKYGHMMKPVLDRIRKEGPLASKDFIPPPGKKRGTWWDWRPAKVALELLFWRGELMITERRNFQRVYDLTERVLPDHVDTKMPDDDELGRFFVKRALVAYGIAQEKEIREHIDGIENNIITNALNELTESGDVLPVTVEGIKNTRFFALPDLINVASVTGKTSSGIHLLSPFDNFIIQRERINRLFGFDYALECYIPAPKRKHGYFVLPILYGGRFVGRLDPKADRKNRTLIIRNLQFESGFKISDRFLKAFTGKLREFARFNECDHIKLQRVSSAKAKNVIEKGIKKTEN